MKDEQLVLTLPYRISVDRLDFFVAPSNEKAVSLVDDWPHWDNRVQVLYGSRSCGKSHLASVWKMSSHAHIINEDSLYESNLVDMMDRPALIIDNLNHLDVENEHILFHLINHAYQKNTYLLFLLYQLPRDIYMTLPDLKSRLLSFPITFMDSPCDVLMRAVIVKLFYDRQLVVDEKIVEYIISRLERSFIALNRLIEQIDYVSYRDKKPITIPLIKQFMT